MASGTDSFGLILKILAPVFLVVGAVHLVFGLGADVMLGAQPGAQALSDPVLDSQNRFYGISFTIYGVLFFLCATDLRRYQTVLRCLLWVFFAAGAARLVSIALHGLPAPMVMGLLGIELMLPAMMLWWLSRLQLNV